MESPPEFRGVASRLAARVTGSRFAALAARAVLVAAGVALLAIIGYAAGPRGLASSAAAATSKSAALEPARDEGPGPSAPASGLPTSPPPPAPVETARPEAPLATAGHAAHGAASADDPVVLNTATVDDFRRLPGIGEKRAAAMLALRDRLGRFRAVEDLLKVKGVGRAMLKRIRPLVRLDARAPPGLDPKAALDGGAATPPP